MKTVLEAVDPQGFAFLRCDVRLPDGREHPVRWLCDIVRVLDALDEEKSTAEISMTDDGSKIYHIFRRDTRFVFKEAIVGDSHIFRIKYHEEIICDDEIRREIRSTGLKGTSFMTTE